MTRRRSFYTLLTEAARTGLIEKVDASQFAGTPEEVSAKLKAWYIAVVGDGKTAGTLTGNKEKPGVLALSRNFSVAVRADIKARAKGDGTRRAVTAESLLAEIQAAPNVPEAASDVLTELDE